MENWAEAIGMQELFQGKILQAKQMRTRLQNLNFLNVRMFQTLSASDFRLTYRTLEQLTLLAASPSKFYRLNSDQTDGASRRKVVFDFAGLDEDGKFIERRSAKLEHIKEVHVRHISDLTQPLTQEMARHLAEGDCFNLFSEFPDFNVSNIHTRLLKHLMAAIPADKPLFVWCLPEYSESPLEALIRCYRCYKLQVATGHMHPNLEIHVVGALFSSSD